MTKDSHALLHFVATLTEQPGVYRMLDSSGTVLYVGKAINLKKRVSSYFSKQNISVKTQTLVTQIASIEITVTRTETEALLLESSLIKSLMPKYNILLRDDKSYPYIHVTKHRFPRMEIFRTRKKPSTANYYGPYPSATSVREVLQLIQKVFKIRNCSDSYFNARSRPCLQYEIKRCTAPCVKFIQQETYQQSVADAIRFLEGKSSLLIDTLTERMQQAVTQLAFEEAGILRDQIKALRLIQEQQAIVHTKGNADVIAVEAQPGFACIQYVSIRNGQVLISRSFFPSVPNIAETEGMPDLWQQTFEAFIAFYYLDNPARIPEFIITNHTLDGKNLLENVLTDTGKKTCRIHINPRGTKKLWLDFALNNLRISITEHQTSSLTIQKRYEALKALLHYDKPVLRMECFDISHTRGHETVASCVVFDATGPVNSQYRQFNIDNITPGDDYAAMKQAVSRRFKYLLETNNLPDILIIDGGKGQVSVACEALDALQIKQVNIIGVAKGPGRKAGFEKLILIDEAREITLPPDSPALHLLQHIRDEAHRFAITSHRKKRNKASFKSSLESLEGIGPKRKQALLYRFGGLRELSKASIEELVKVQGINEALAKKIYDHFHP